MFANAVIISAHFTFILLSFFCGVESSQIAGSKEALGRVIISNVIFRHGRRTITESYPTDPYRNESFWPEGFGQLTNEGKRQEFELGQWLRNRYKDLLSDTYLRTEVYIQSTDVDRTLMSAESNLAGLYPPTGGQRWNDNIEWQPIPVHTVPEELDEVLAMMKPCPKYNEEFKKVMSSSPITNKLSEYSDLLTYLTKYTGEKVNSFSQLQNLYSTLFIENLNKYKLPEWTKKIFPDPLKSAAAFSFCLKTFTDGLKRLKTGPFLKVMLHHFEKSIGLKDSKLLDDNAKENKKLWMYSAHDETVASILDTFKVFEHHNPPFTACVLIELREKGNDYFVTISYRNSSGDASLLTIPGCSALCPYNQFVEILKPLIPSNWENECQASRIFNLTGELPYNYLALSLIFTMIVLALLLLTTILVWQRQRPTRFYKKLKTDSI